MMIDREPEECVSARVIAQGGGRYVVLLERADGEPVPPILCTSAEKAALLVCYMNPRNADELLAALAALAAQDAGSREHDLLKTFVETFVEGLEANDRAATAHAR